MQTLSGKEGDCCLRGEVSVALKWVKVFQDRPRGTEVLGNTEQEGKHSSKGN